VLGVVNTGVLSAELGELLSFVGLYLQNSTNTKEEWETLIKTLLSSSNKIEFISLAVQKVRQCLALLNLVDLCEHKF
jgi:hypothetical protein